MSEKLVIDMELDDVLEIRNIGGELLLITTPPSDGFYVSHAYEGDDGKGFAGERIFLSSGTVRNINIGDDVPYVKEPPTSGNPRVDAWLQAENLVKEMVDRHGLNDYAIGSVLSPSTRMTAVDQHIDHIMRVADWLLGDDS